jgi:hypothetical protein
MAAITSSSCSLLNQDALPWIPIYPVGQAIALFWFRREAKETPTTSWCCRMSRRRITKAFKAEKDATRICYYAQATKPKDL